MGLAETILGTAGCFAAGPVKWIIETLFLGIINKVLALFDVSITLSGPGPTMVFGLALTVALWKLGSGKMSYLVGFFLVVIPLLCYV